MRDELRDYKRDTSQDTLTKRAYKQTQGFYNAKKFPNRLFPAAVKIDSG